MSRPRPTNAARRLIFFGATTALSAGCASTQTQPPPAPVVQTAPCLAPAQVPSLPALRLESLPLTAPLVEVVRATALDREALIVAVVRQHRILLECAR